MGLECLTGGCPLADYCVRPPKRPWFITQIALAPPTCRSCAGHARCASWSGMRKLWLAILTTLLGGCGGASWVHRSYEPKGGTLSYLNEGMGWVRERRVAAAVDEMKAFCAPQGVAILSESAAQSNPTYNAYTNPQTGVTSVGSTTSSYTLLTFECRGSAE
jgi:hypothetical protein